MNDQTIVCILDGSRGIYIPQKFAEFLGWNVTDEAKTILRSGPDHPEYWDVWDEVMNYAQMKDESGKWWNLWQDGDLFAVREDHNFDD